MPFATGSQSEPDIQAAFALANYYHYGIRGVEQNLALALHYYEIAADGGSLEAAGIVGKFHLLGIGYEGDEYKIARHKSDPTGEDDKPKGDFLYKFHGNITKAYKYLVKGTPGGIKGCSTKLNNKDDPYAKRCDPEAMNGMGLANLVGLPFLVPPNKEKAFSYFKLARDTGSSDGAFHYGMMKLGWFDGGEMLDALSDVNNFNFKGSSTGQVQNKKNKHKDFLDPEYIANAAQMALNSVNGDHSGPVTMIISADSISNSPDNESNGKKDSEINNAISNLERAAKTGHLQAAHRLGIIYSHGISYGSMTPLARRRNKKNQKDGPKKYAIAPKCEVALKWFRQVVESSPSVSHRTRRAYKQYISGDKIEALKNYMAAAETGNELSMVNAAWLLERYCPLPNKNEHWKCRRASLRYWTEAARLGNNEANLNLGDFYYYNKLSGSSSISKKHLKKSGSQDKFMFETIQTAWNWLLYPELLWVDTRSYMVKVVKSFLKKKTKKRKTVKKHKTSQESAICAANGDDPTCAYNENRVHKSSNKTSDQTPDNLELAAMYYQRADKSNISPRGSFNLGFMYQWYVHLLFSSSSPFFL